MKRINLIQGSDEWLQYRQGGIGGSDIAAIAGISPFKNAQDVYDEKTGNPKDRYISAAMLRGTHFEGEARHQHNKATNKNFHPLVVQHEEYDFFFASLDGYDEMENEILEIKVPYNGDLIEKTARGEIHDYYNAQVQWQLFVSGAETAIFAVYWPETQRMEEIIIDRDEALIERLRSIGVDFWNNLQEGVPPPGKIDYIQKSFPDYSDYFFRYAELKEKESLIKRELEYYRSLILDLGPKDNWEAHNLRITNSKGRTQLDIKAMQEDGIDLDKYRKPGKTYFKLEVMK